MKTYKQLMEEIETLKHQAEEIREKERTSAIAEVKEKIVTFGLTAADCGFAQKPSSAKPSVATKQKKRMVTPKYRHPEDPSLTWTGRGKTPRWLSELEANGMPRDKLKIQP